MSRFAQVPLFTDQTKQQIVMIERDLEVAKREKPELVTFYEAEIKRLKTLVDREK